MRKTFNLFAILIFCFIGNSIVSCKDDSPPPAMTVDDNDTTGDPGNNDSTVNKNPKSFQYVKFENSENEMVFYKKTFTRARGQTSNYPPHMEVELALDGYPDSKLRIETDQLTEGDKNFHESIAGPYIISAKAYGFESDTGSYITSSSQFPGDMNFDTCRIYKKDGKFVIHVVNGRLKDPDGFDSKLSFELFWPE